MTGPDPEHQRLSAIYWLRWTGKCLEEGIVECVTQEHDDIDADLLEKLSPGIMDVQVPGLYPQLTPAIRRVATYVADLNGRAQRWAINQVGREAIYSKGLRFAQLVLEGGGLWERIPPDDRTSCALELLREMRIAIWQNNGSSAPQPLAPALDPDGRSYVMGLKIVAALEWARLRMRQRYEPGSTGIEPLEVAGARHEALLAHEAVNFAARRPGQDPAAERGPSAVEEIALAHRIADEAWGLARAHELSEARQQEAIGQLRELAQRLTDPPEDLAVQGEISLLEQLWSLVEVEERNSALRGSRIHAEAEAIYAWGGAYEPERGVHLGGVDGIRVRLSDGIAWLGDLEQESSKAEDGLEGEASASIAEMAGSLGKTLDALEWLVREGRSIIHGRPDEEAASESRAGLSSWILTPFEAVGPLRFGASRIEVRRVLAEEPHDRGDDPVPNEHFRTAGVWVEYDHEGRLLAVEGSERPIRLSRLSFFDRPATDVRRDAAALGLTVDDGDDTGLNLWGIGLRLFAEQDDNGQFVVRGATAVRDDYGLHLDRLRVGGWNPYLEEFLAQGLNDPWAFDLPGRRDVGLEESARRARLQRELRARYAYAVPGESALQVIGEYQPIVELGAGNGYWSRCLAERGIDVVAYDQRGEEWKARFPDQSTWHPVRQGGVEVVKEHPGHTLLIVWPPFATDFASKALGTYEGEHFLYVGEALFGDEGSATGDLRFHEMLAKQWELVEEVPIPVFELMHDRLQVWRRKREQRDDRSAIPGDELGEGEAERYRGGPYRDLPRRPGQELHFVIPAAALHAQGLDAASAPAIQMRAADHRRVSGWGVRSGDDGTKDAPDGWTPPDPTADFEAWRTALLALGWIPAADRDDIDVAAAERDCYRYAALTDLVTGEEGKGVLQALFDSIQVDEDHEVYEATLGAIGRFPGEMSGELLYRNIAALMGRAPFRAWDLLNQLAMGSLGFAALKSFRETWGVEPRREWEWLLAAILRDERSDGWLQGSRAGVLRPFEAVDPWQEPPPLRGEGWDGHWTGPGAPVSAEGTVDGKAWYFRARGEKWYFAVGESSDDAIRVGWPRGLGGTTGWLETRRWGRAEFAASWMRPTPARRLIEICIARWRQGQIPWVRPKEDCG